MGEVVYASVQQIATGIHECKLSARSIGPGFADRCQMIGRRWGDMDLLAVADQVASITQGFVHPPALRP